MANTANIKAVISAEDNASRVLAGFGNATHALAKGLAIGIGVAAAATTAFAVSAVKAFSESQNVIAQTNAVIKSTGGVAGVTADQVGKLASSLQKVTKFSDEQIQTGENLLLTFTKIGKDIFPQATEVMLDMSQALGQDVKSSAIQLGKALQDPVLGITALRRVGVNFNDEQKKVIENLVKTGKSAEAQALILKELQVEFGGSARAAGETFAGKLAILRNSFDDVKESIGKAIVDGLTPLAGKLTEFVASDQFQQWLTRMTDWLRVNLPAAINYVTQTLLPALINIFNEVWPAIKTVLEWGGQLIKFLGDNTWIVWGIVNAFLAFKAALIIDAAAKAFMGMLALIRGEVLLTTGTMAASTGAAGGLHGALMKLKGPFLIALGIVGAEIVIATIKEVGKALEHAKSKLDDFNKEKINVGGQNVSKGSDIGLIQGFKNMFPGMRAAGGPVASGSPYVVGERGPEMFVPGSSGTIVPNNQLGGGTINLSVNIGMYAGTPMEKREIAKSLAKSLQDVARQYGVSPTQLLDGSNGVMIR